MQLSDIIARFDLPSDVVSVKGNTQGHINNTYILKLEGGQGCTLQRVNGQVFPHPVDVMENIALVTGHIQQKDPDPRHSLHLFKSKEKTNYVTDDEGSLWRAYAFIDQAHTYDKVTDPEAARELGKAIGRFQSQLSDLPGSRLHETIKDFHNPHMRFLQLREAIKAGQANRVQETGAQITFLLENEQRSYQIWDLWHAGKLPTRVTHNDTKINNVLFDDKTNEALCVIDLDTVMPGSLLFDTGDMIRTATNTAMEDEGDTSKVHFDKTFYDSLMKGYLSEAGSFITPLEKELLFESGRTITLIQAVRFLTDYLNGDIYYHTERPKQNLDRANCQIALVKSMDKAE